MTDTTLLLLCIMLILTFGIVGITNQLDKIIKALDKEIG